MIRFLKWILKSHSKKHSYDASVALQFNGVLKILFAFHSEEFDKFILYPY